MELSDSLIWPSTHHGCCAHPARRFVHDFADMHDHPSSDTCIAAHTRTQQSQVHAHELLQVVMALGPVRGQDGKRTEMSSEKVDAQGVSNIAEAAASKLPKASLMVDPIMQSKDFNDWEKKNDQVMGGSSTSEVSAQEGSNSAHPCCVL